MLSAVTLLAFGAFNGTTADAQEPEFLRGDANTDGIVSISDALMVRRFLFNGERRPPCLDAADVNDSGSLNITDMIYTLNAILLGGPGPANPYPVIGPDATEDHLDPCEYDVVPPEGTEDVIRIGEVSAAPGDEVEIPVYVTNAQPVEAFQLVLRYDPDVLQFDKGFKLVFEGTHYSDILQSNPTGGSFQSVSPVAGEGILLVGFIPAFIDTGYETPPGEDRLVFKIPGKVAEDAPSGAEVILEPYNGEDDAGYGDYALRNEFTSSGSARFLSLIPRTINGLLEIVADVTIFRGDSNDDGTVNISDASFTLSYLFLGGTEPRCPDAADANDDGRVDVSDPVVTLWTLFGGEAASIAAPYPELGFDATPDELGDCALPAE